MSVGFNKILIDADGIHLDGYLIPGTHVLPDITVHQCGENTRWETVTLTLGAEQITITPEAKQLPSAHITIKHGL